MQGGVERPLSDLERVARDLSNVIADSPAMHGFQRKRLENQQIQRALDDIGRFRQLRSSPVEAKGEYGAPLLLRKGNPVASFAPRYLTVADASRWQRPQTRCFPCPPRAIPSSCSAEQCDG